MPEVRLHGLRRGAGSAGGSLTPTAYDAGVKHERAEQVEELHLKVGEELELESLRAAVVPPHLFLLPFLEAPEGIEIERQVALDEDGVHGSTFHLRATKPVDGELVVGFRDMRTHETTHVKSIHVSVEAANGVPADAPSQTDVDR